MKKVRTQGIVDLRFSIEGQSRDRAVNFEAMTMVIKHWSAKQTINLEGVLPK